ncbi:GLTSCR protein [Homalodisca vitripennis]|nr:GLTSCR protein [Homalodisca vitripennis]
MALLQELNKVGDLKFKEYKRLIELEENKKYKILNLEKMKDKFGFTIIAELEDYKVHLPNRFLTVLDEKKIKELNKNDKLHLVVTGKKTIKDKDCVTINFVGTQTSCELSPSPPALSHAKRSALIEQQQRADRQGATAPDVNTPFASTSDAVKRLVRYHCLDEPVFSESDLSKADEIFEATARHLLDKNAQMLNKYNYLLLMESMRQVQTSELIMLGRMFVSDETARLEAAKVEASQPPPAKKEREEKSPVVRKETEDKERESGEQRTAKREREETDEGVGVKKHCADDEEINAQVQNAIDSILNLGSNRSDPALDEAVRSILSS